MLMRKFWISTLGLMSLLAIFATGCNSTKPVDPGSGGATYRFGAFTSFLPGTVKHNFDVANLAMDEHGLFRTGQRRSPARKEIYARTRTDLVVEVVLLPTTDGRTQITIKWGNFGNEEESARLFERILQTSQSL